MFALLRLRRRGEQRGIERLVFGHAFRKRVPTVVALALLVGGPDRRARYAGQIAAHHELDRQDLDLLDDRHRRIRHLDQVVGRDVAGLVEPEGGELVQHLALQRDGSHHDVETADPVADHDRAALLADVAVANLPLDAGAQFGHVRPLEGAVTEFLQELRIDGHGFPRESGPAGCRAGERDSNDAVGGAEGSAPACAPDHAKRRSGGREPANPQVSAADGRSKLRGHWKSHPAGVARARAGIPLGGGGAQRAHRDRGTHRDRAGAAPRRGRAGTSAGPGCGLRVALEVPVPPHQTARPRLVRVGLLRALPRSRPANAMTVRPPGWPSRSWAPRARTRPR